MGFRAIERTTEVHQTTVINWVRESVAKSLEDDDEDAPKLGELDELQTYVEQQSQKIWIWAASKRHCAGILAIAVGNRSGETLKKLWQQRKDWRSRKYITDGYCVYSNYIDSERHLVLPKTKLTRVEGENSRLRHYLARLGRLSNTLIVVAYKCHQLLGGRVWVDLNPLALI